jgi:hypothetical protein
MNPLLTISETAKSLISVLELKRLLVDLKQKRPDICFRYRLLGEMWMTNAMRVISVTEKGVLLNDEPNNKLNTISDLSLIMQFEIDAPFQGFQPHFHYHVKAMPDFK